LILQAAKSSKRSADEKLVAIENAYRELQHEFRAKEKWAELAADEAKAKLQALSDNNRAIQTQLRDSIANLTALEVKDSEKLAIINDLKLKEQTAASDIIALSQSVQILKSDLDRALQVQHGLVKSLDDANIVITQITENNSKLQCRISTLEEQARYISLYSFNC
jgi:hypothetical protein